MHAFFSYWFLSRPVNATMYTSFRAASLSQRGKGRVTWLFPHNQARYMLANQELGYVYIYIDLYHSSFQGIGWIVMIGRK
jgi:hypothetical protein